MRSFSISVVLTTVLLTGVTGCASDDPAAAPAPAASGNDQAFPLTVTRTGGFAGVDDRAEIAADGSAVVTMRGRPAVRTTLPAGAMAELRARVTAPDFAGRQSPSGVCNDGLAYEFVSPSASKSLSGCETSEDRTVAVVAPLFNS